jgi:hypothetical protein
MTRRPVRRAAPLVAVTDLGDRYGEAILTDAGWRTDDPPDDPPDDHRDHDREPSERDREPHHN